ncbi:PhzF family phenazine biosynthesis protein [Marinobacter nauticus]
MKTTPIYQVDVFTSEVFGGNPAAVMPLEAWLSEQQLQAIALENNLSETAFVVPLPDAPATSFYVPNDTNYMVELTDEAAVLETAPDLRKLAQLGNQGLIVTAPGSDCDFVSRYFAPGAGIDEDPVTGSIHSVLTPYWAEKLGKNTLYARQLSKRGGELRCELRGERVAIAGQAAFYMEGAVSLP